MSNIDDLLNCLKIIRNEEESSILFADAKEVAANIGEELMKPRTTSRSLVPTNTYLMLLSTRGVLQSIITIRVLTVIIDIGHGVDEG